MVRWKISLGIIGTLLSSLLYADTVKIGAVVIPASFQLKKHDLAYRFQCAKVKLAVVVELPEVLDEVLDALIHYDQSLKLAGEK